MQRPRIDKTIFKKNNKFGGLTLILKLSIKLHVIMTMGYWPKNRHSGPEYMNN